MFPFRFCFGVALRLIAYLFLPFLSPYFCPPPLSLSHSFCRPHVSKEAKSLVCGATLNKLLQQQQQLEHVVRFRINNSNLASLLDVQPICFIPSTADMVEKIELIYSPNQVSNHFKKTDQTVDWEICFPYYFEPVELLVEVTFKCRDFQSDVTFNVRNNKNTNKQKKVHISLTNSAT